MKRKKADNFLIHKVLRLKKEPCVYYDESVIHQAFMKKASQFMKLLERFYRAWHRNENIALLPHKQVFITKGIQGDFRIMPCVIQNFEKRIIKAVKVIGTDIEQKVIRDKISVGKALLLHPKDNFVEAIFDVGSLTSFRTAAVSVLAYEHLARDKRGIVGIIGAGRVGFYTAVILHERLGIREILVEDANPKHLSNFIRGLKTAFPRLQVAGGTLKEITAGSSALFLTTNAASPILSYQNAGHVNFISSIGADSDTQSELESSILKGRQVFTDSISSIRFGDLKRWQERGLIEEDSLTELREIVATRKPIRKKILFVSTGIAVHDALACQFLFDHLSRR